MGVEYSSRCLFNGIVVRALQLLRARLPVPDKGVSLARWGHARFGYSGTGTNAYAMAINEQGQAIGISYTNSTPNQVTTRCSSPGSTIPTQDPFLWENGKMIDIGTLGGTCGFPSWINSHGQVVGYSDLVEDQVNHPFLWTNAKGMQDLGTLGGSYGTASMINRDIYLTPPSATGCGLIKI